MNMNLSSTSEIIALLKKLADERVPMHAAFRSINGTKARVSGFLEGFSRAIELVVSGKADSGYLAVPFADRPFTFDFGDKRELPEDELPLADKFGNSRCSITFTDTGDLLILVFDLPM
jgi:hypothetical protein